MARAMAFAESKGRAYRQQVAPFSINSRCLVNSNEVTYGLIMCV